MCLSICVGTMSLLLLLLVFCKGVCGGKCGHCKIVIRKRKGERGASSFLVRRYGRYCGYEALILFCQQLIIA